MNRATMLSTFRLSAAVLAATLLAPAASRAESVCVTVKLVIPQRLSLERDAFAANLRITNTLEDTPLTNLDVRLAFSLQDGTPAEEFFFDRFEGAQPPAATPDGMGAVPADSTATMNWLIIPVPGAGGTTVAGVTYRVKAVITYTAAGQNFTLETLDEVIFVQPQPELELDYALPRYVDGDDPFTPAPEPSVPFELAVRVANVGLGEALTLRIASLQPRIVENATGALVEFRLVGTFMNDQAIANSLTIRFGDLAPQRCGTGAWAMTTSLQGRMTELSATYTHREDLGGARTSLIREIRSHRLFQRIQVDTAGKDAIPDLLVDLGPTPDGTVDAILESDCFTTPVTTVPATASGSPDTVEPSFLVSAESVFGWNHMEVPDPAEGLRPIRRVVRLSDGKVLHPRNAWLTRTEGGTRTLAIADFPPPPGDPQQYRVYLDFSDADDSAPITALNIEEPRHGNAPTYITPYTLMTFTAVDLLGEVARTEYRVDGGAFTTFTQPFHVPGPGRHLIEFRSVDRRGNMEMLQSAEVSVDAAGPSATVRSPVEGRTYLVGEMLPVDFSVTDDDPGALVTARIVPVTGSLELIVRAGDVVDLAEFTVGSYEFEVRGVDWLGQATRKVVRFIVQENPGACANVPDGTACDDRLPCTLDDTCAAGTCSGAPNTCDDTNPCTADSCHAVTGCAHAPTAGTCSDNNACTQADTCVDGACTGMTVTCTDGNACTDDTCDAAGGCVFTPNTSSCNDGNACTQADTCGAGTCTGTPVSCDDGNPCTADACDAMVGCTHAPVTGTCDDGNTCTTGDTCTDGACTGARLAEGSPCNDGLSCTAMDTCSAAGTCTGAAVACSGNTTCTEPTCCGTTPVTCDDGDDCTWDQCAADGGCQHVPHPSCVDAGTPPVDAGTADAATPADAGTPDATGPDASVADASLPDAARVDAGRTDAGTADAGRRDGGNVNPVDGGGTVGTDAGTPPVGPPPDDGCACDTSGTPRVQVAWLAGVVLLGLRIRRRR